MKRIGFEMTELMQVASMVKFCADGDAGGVVSVDYHQPGGGSFMIDFTINNRYPFAPPAAIHINGKHKYREWLCSLLPRFKAVAIELGYPGCLCEMSLLCNDNWSPALTLKALLFEVVEICRIKRYIMLVWWCRQVAATHITHDVPIWRYL